MSIIERIVQTMDNKNLNQNELCSKLGIRNSTFSTWKTRNTDPPAKYILLICEYLNVTPDWLLGRTENPTIIQNNSISTGNINGNHNANMNINSDINEDNAELLEMINGLSLVQKSEIVLKINEMKNNRS